MYKMKNESPQTLAELSYLQAQLYNDKSIFFFNEKTSSYSQFDVMSNQVANALINENIKPKSRVAFLGKDSLYAYEILFGSAKAKTVFMPLNWRLTSEEILFLINDGGCEIIFVEEEFLHLVESLDSLKVIVINNNSSNHQTYLDWKSDQSTSKPDFTYDSTDVVAQIYTSGTTGIPKGVQIANYTFFRLSQNMARHEDNWMEPTDEDSLTLSLPIFHIGGMWWAIQGLAKGALMFIIDTFVPWKVLELIEKHKITVVGMVPAMMQFTLLEPALEKTDLSCVKQFLYGGSPISSDLLKKTMKFFDCDFYKVYGMTETGNMAVCLGPEDHRKDSDRLLKSTGKPLIGVEVKIVDIEQNSVPANSIGEIWIKTPLVMIGYWRNEQADNETLIDGWIRSGDAGYLDEDGYLFISDRIKDMIIYAGENIYPAEIENILASHENVKEVAVIGVPDEKWGELVKAIVVPKEEALINKSILVNFLKGKIADFKIPKSFSFVNSLPRNSSGKLLKTELKKSFWENQERLVN